MYSEEELNEIDKKLKEASQKAEEYSKKFWNIDYHQLDINGKVNFWVANIHKGMRIHGESTGDEYGQFSKNWYEWVKAIDPDFDLIFRQVVPKLGFNFNWDEYYKRIELNRVLTDHNLKE